MSGSAEVSSSVQEQWFATYVSFRRHSKFAFREVPSAAYCLSSGIPIPVSGDPDHVAASVAGSREAQSSCTA